MPNEKEGTFKHRKESMRDHGHRAASEETANEMGYEACQAYGAAKR